MRIRDVNTPAAVLFVDTFKGAGTMGSIPPFLGTFDRYLAARVTFAPASPDASFFVAVDQTRLPVNCRWRRCATSCSIFSSTMSLALGNTAPSSPSKPNGPRAEASYLAVR